ncbi:MAG: YfhO family protein, partial [Verrucomicrobia bacterium]|nr:YfhO family protein [Verrucomicrobiota bacterium]
QYFTISEKYATNPVLDVLADKPWEHRVTVPAFREVPPAVSQYNNLLQQVFHIEWLQHHFQLLNIQALEVAQMPRVPEDFAAFNGALAGQMLRSWQLMNTRYILALAGFTDAFNIQIDPQKKRFRNVLLFDITQRPGGGITAVTNTTGPFALVEFSGALPRARLYDQWQVSTNDDATLKRLVAPDFDPEQTVLVAENIPAAPAAASNAAPATVEFLKYTPRQFSLRARAATPTVLLVNDRYDPNWEIRVDGKRADLLRCNYIMRGVRLPAGEHVVSFRFRARLTGLKIMAGAEGFGLLLGAVLMVARFLPARTADRKSGDAS